MGLVAGGAVCVLERLVLVCRCQRGIFRVMAIQAKRWSRLGQMELEFAGRAGTSLMGNVAGIASHIERGVVAAFVRGIQSGVVALQAKVLVLASRQWLQ